MNVDRMTKQQIDAYYNLITENKNKWCLASYNECDSIGRAVFMLGSCSAYLKEKKNLQYKGQCIPIQGVTLDIGSFRNNLLKNRILISNVIETSREKKLIVPQSQIKSTIIKTIKQSQKVCYLFYSGHGQQSTGDWLLQTENNNPRVDMNKTNAKKTQGEKNEHKNTGSQQNKKKYKQEEYDHKISLCNILNWWDENKGENKNKKLIIIADSCFSGKWCDLLNKLNKKEPRTDIAMMASSRGDQKSINFYGGLLISSICRGNDKHERCKIIFQFQTPIISNFNSQLVLVQSADLLAANKQLMKLQQILNFRIMEFPDGLYRGQLNNKKQRHGLGTMRWKNKESYSGYWRENKMHGTGKIVYADETWYEGEWKNNERYGSGTRYYAEDNQYTGEWEYNMRTGEGKQLEFGNQYTGMFFQNQYHGEGLLKYLDGTYYKGTFQKGKKNGKGQMHYGENHYYKGDWKDDEMTGKGKFVYPNGDIYQGDFYCGLLHGKGRLKYSNKSYYQGSFSKDQKNGYGVSYTNQNEFYKGYYVNGLRQGQGERKFGDQTYVGEWKNDKRQGFGKMYVKGKIIKEGKWVNNKFQGTQIKQKPQNYNKISPGTPNTMEQSYQFQANPQIDNSMEQNKTRYRIQTNIFPNMIQTNMTYTGQGVHVINFPSFPFFNSPNNQNFFNQLGIALGSCPPP